MTSVTSRPRGRPKTFDSEQALEKAMNVFWSRGYEGASLAELTEALGINKPSLYAAFGNKEELFRKAVGRYLQGPSAFVGEAVEAPTSRQVAENFLLKAAEFLTDDRHPKGCMVVQGALSCGQGAELIHQELINYRDQYEKALRKRFKKARKEGDLPEDADPAQLAKLLATLHQGMSVQASSGATREQLVGVVNAALKHWPGK